MRERIHCNLGIAAFAQLGTNAWMHYSDHYKRLLEYIEKLGVEGGLEEEESTEVMYELSLPASVRTADGHVALCEDTEQWLIRFDIALGPSNARRLIEFLRSLPDEPVEEG